MRKHISILVVAAILISMPSALAAPEDNRGVTANPDDYICVSPDELPERRMTQQEREEEILFENDAEFRAQKEREARVIMEEAMQKAAEQVASKGTCSQSGQTVCFGQVISALFLHIKAIWILLVMLVKDILFIP